MVRIRSTNDIILDSIDFYRASQPSLDTKPGTVARDLLIEGPASQLGRLYEELNSVKSAQSLRLSIGTDLDKLATNYGASRKQGSKSSGTAIFTFSSIEADITINKGDIVSANNGATFSVLTSQTVTSLNTNRYRATASKYRSYLDFVGITDEFATETTVESTATGTLGNISSFSINSTTIAGVTNVTNVRGFSGGSQAETDANFKARILGIFSGSNTGTELGYKNAILSDPATQDAIVVGPGDELMTRDGTQVNTAEDGTKTIITDGTGGKVDIYVLGTRLTEVLDSYVYRDLSNQNDPTDSDNDFVLGQIDGDENKTVTKKRIQNIQNETLPAQPINDIIEVLGSSSGANFIAKQTDSLGRVTGNYELIRDSGAYAGSPWGFDKLHWISSQIEDFSEDISKGRFNGQDPSTFSDLIKINKITQEIQIINENSAVNPSNRASIQLSHYPVSTVSRVFNLTTGERYVISSQNPDGGSTNTTGKITISGNTLPAVSDTLQLDYTWAFDYDPFYDFDNKETSNNPRDVLDSIDWGYSNAVKREESTIATGLVVTTTHPITSVISINIFEQDAATVSLVQGRLAAVMPLTITQVTSVKRDGDSAELYQTSNDDGTFSGLTIFLPTDTLAVFGDTVTVTYNAEDTYNIDNAQGSFESNVITLPSIATVTVGTVVECNYIANIKTILPTTILSSLPAVQNGNSFNTITSTSIGTQPTTHVYADSTIIQNLRIAPSRLQLTLSGSVSQGTFTVRGTTTTRVAEALITVSSAGLRHNLSSAIKTKLGLKSTDTVPSNVFVSKLAKLARVTAQGSEVISIDHEYNIKGYKLYNNAFSLEESVSDSSLTSTEIELPATPDNEEETLSIGQKILVTFHICTTSNSENVAFSKAGSLYTHKTFALIETISISSGFTSASSQAASLTVSNQNQPASGTRYASYYDYLAPKANERITIRYNQNQLITDGTLAIESVRPISADVLVKAAVPISVDATLYIVVSSSFITSSTIVKQNVQDVITATINANTLNTILDASDLVQAAYTVSGVDRVRIIYFNITGETGSLLSIQAEKNEYLRANNVTVTVETR